MCVWWWWHPTCPIIAPWTDGAKKSNVLKDIGNDWRDASVSMTRWLLCLAWCNCNVCVCVWVYVCVPVVLLHVLREFNLHALLSKRRYTSISKDLTYAAAINSSSRSCSADPRVVIITLQVLCLYVYVYVFMFMCLCLCFYVYVFMFMYLCLCFYVYVFMFMCLRSKLHINKMSRQT